MTHPKPSAAEDRAAMSTSAHDSLAYIRRFYGVPAELKGRIRYTWRGERYGTIVGTSVASLMILLDGERHPAPYHPTWEIEYLGEMAGHTVTLVADPERTNRYTPACTCGWVSSKTEAICRAQAAADRHERAKSRVAS